MFITAIRLNSGETFARALRSEEVHWAYECELRDKLLTWIVEQQATEVMEAWITFNLEMDRQHSPPNSGEILYLLLLELLKQGQLENFQGLYRTYYPYLAPSLQGIPLCSFLQLGTEDSFELLEGCFPRLTKEAQYEVLVELARQRKRKVFRAYYRQLEVVAEDFPVARVAKHSPRLFRFLVRSGHRNYLTSLIGHLSLEKLFFQEEAQGSPYDPCEALMAALQSQQKRIIEFLLVKHPQLDMTLAVIQLAYYEDLLTPYLGRLIFDPTIVQAVLRHQNIQNKVSAYVDYAH